MIGQTVALFVDAYRELNARKLFWIALALSGIVVLAFAAVGVQENSLKVLWFSLDLPLGSIGVTPEVFYKTLFLEFGIGFWLSWLVTILALVTTAGIIPEFISSGSIDLALSKPIGRVRLLLTKYATGLLFVGLQVTVFTAASFLVLGFRGGAWEPGLFLAIPVVVIFFSYLYAICTLLGLITRSTIAALLLTLLVWFLFFALNAVDVVMLQAKGMKQQQVASTQRAVERDEARLEAIAQDGDFEERRVRMEESLATLRERLEGEQGERASIERWHGRVYAVKTVVPKTAETIALLERWLVDAADLPKPETGNSQITDGPMAGTDPHAAAIEAQLALRERSVWWVMGTSLLFEAAVLGLACLIFVRRDF